MWFGCLEVYFRWLDYSWTCILGGWTCILGVRMGSVRTDPKHIQIHTKLYIKQFKLSIIKYL